MIRIILFLTLVLITTLSKHIKALEMLEEKLISTKETQSQLSILLVVKQKQQFQKSKESQ